MTTLKMQPQVNEIRLRLNEGMVDAVTLNGEQTLANKTLVGAAIAGGPLRFSSVSAEEQIDCQLGNYFHATVEGGASFTFANVPDTVYECHLRVDHVSGAIAWPSNVLWPSDSAPLLAQGTVHWFRFWTDDGGTTWFGDSRINYEPNEE